MVVAECAGSRIGLQAAQANAGWHVQVDSRGPGEVRVNFVQGGDGGEAEVTAACRSGAPVFEVSGDR
jgi:hypothetical protein